jgi:predicted metal-dependent RNase
MDGLIRAKKGERLTTAAPGRIYALSSGMMSEYTASNDFAYNFIDNPKNSVIFVGYADPDSPGGHLRKAAAGDPVKLHHAYPPVTLRAEVEAFDFSGHATRDELVEYAKRVRPRKLLLVHGDAPAMAWMVPALQAALPETEVIVPQPGERVRLDG